MVEKWPSKGWLSHFQLGAKKVTLNHLDHIPPFTGSSENHHRLKSAGDCRGYVFTFPGGYIDNDLIMIQLTYLPEMIYHNQLVIPDPPEFKVSPISNTPQEKHRRRKILEESTLQISWWSSLQIQTPAENDKKWDLHHFWIGLDALLFLKKSDLSLTFGVWIRISRSPTFKVGPTKTIQIINWCINTGIFKLIRFGIYICIIHILEWWVMK